MDEQDFKISERFSCCARLERLRSHLDHHFSHKKEETRQNITPASRNVLVLSEPSTTLSHFELIRPSDSEEISHRLSSSTCQLGIITTRFLKQVFQTVGPDILSIH